MSETEPIIYTGAYTNWSREDILKEVKTKVKKSRFKHILRVETYAIQLAQHYGADEEACSLAAILHDYAKDIERNQIEAMVSQGELDPELLAYGSQIWHGPAGAHFAQHRFGIQDRVILKAIEQHTIGGEEMPLVSKVLFIADYVELGRSFPGVEQARQLAQKDLNRACMYKISQTLVHLVTEQRVVYPKTIAVYNAWVKKWEAEAIE